MKVSPGLHQRHEHGLVRLAAGVRLHVGEAAVEQAAGALDRELLGDVDELAAAVVAPAWIAFGVFVRHHRALRLEHGAGDDVLGGDELDLVALATELELDGAGDLRIGVGEVRREEAVRELPLRRLGRAHARLDRDLVSREPRRTTAGRRPSDNSAADGRGLACVAAPRQLGEAPEAHAEDG